MVWQAFVPDIASGQLTVFDMAEKRRKKKKEKKKRKKKQQPGKRNYFYGQCKSDEPCQMCRCHILAASEARNKAERL